MRHSFFSIDTTMILIWHSWDIYNSLNWHFWDIHDFLPGHFWDIHDSLNWHFWDIYDSQLTLMRQLWFSWLTLMRYLWSSKLTPNKIVINSGPFLLKIEVKKLIITRYCSLNFIFKFIRLALNGRRHLAYAAMQRHLAYDLRRNQCNDSWPQICNVI